MWKHETQIGLIALQLQIFRCTIRSADLWAREWYGTIMLTVVLFKGAFSLEEPNISPLKICAPSVSLDNAAACSQGE